MFERQNRGLHVVLGLAFFVVVWALPAPSTAEPARVGEPYQLEGNRLVFTNWIYVRPGDVEWVDSEGNSVNADESVSMGPFEAVWAPVDHMPWGIQLKAHKPEGYREWKIEPEYPWEAGGSISIRTILNENGVYKAWGSCQAGNCYFESEDCTNWRRPKLGLIEFEGSTANNLIPHMPIGDVFVDPTSEDERYKSIWVEGGEMPIEELEAFKKKYPDDWGPRVLRWIDGKPHVTRVLGAVSPDGFHWKTLPEPVLMEHCDTHNIGYYDPKLKKYVAYVRTWNALERAPSLPVEENRWDYWLPNARRSIARAESDDFRHFPRSELLLEATPYLAPTDGLYTNCFTWIPGAPEHLMMFPAIRHLHDDTTTIAMLSSPNGKNWHWVPGGEKLIETGPYGRWDGGCVWAIPPLMELADGSFAIRISGHNFPHKYPRGQREIGEKIAVWPHGRIASIEAAEKGEFGTVAVVPKGTKLYLNARTLRTGYIRVAAQYGVRYGDIIPGREFENAIPIVGDQPRAPVQWKDADDLGIELGEPVILLFKMEQAEIFSLEFK